VIGDWVSGARRGRFHIHEEGGVAVLSAGYFPDGRRDVGPVTWETTAVDALARANDGWR